MIFRTFVLPVALILFFLSCLEVKNDIVLPSEIDSGIQGKFHVQGIAVDKKRGHLYFSFTDRLVKTDLSGNFIGSVSGFVGHLGNIDIDEDTGFIYGSLEYKNDVIGQNIREKLNIEEDIRSAFFVAVFNGSLIREENIDVSDTDVVKFSYLKEVVSDFSFTHPTSDGELKHKYGCSGIDGITIGPDFGVQKSKRYLFVAYGIYEDTSRTDNDYQVLLAYDINEINQTAKQLQQDIFHKDGPARPAKKYFVKTGNTRYGIQNLSYDSFSGDYYAFVYKGSKNDYPNFDLFVIDREKDPVKKEISYYEVAEEIDVLTLSEMGIKDEATKLNGWFFSHGTTGAAPLGDGRFYISHEYTDDNGKHGTIIYKYRWDGDQKVPFKMVE